MPTVPIKISPEMYVIVQGQIGNIKAKLRYMQRLMIDHDLTEFIPAAQEVVAEVDFLQRCLPADPNEIQIPGNASKKDTEHERENESGS